MTFPIYTKFEVPIDRNVLRDGTEEVHQYPITINDALKWPIRVSVGAHGFTVTMSDPFGTKIFETRVETPQPKCQHRGDKTCLQCGTSFR